ncbi:hypothetical protein K445DRAFT_22370 [Daldinia sp. EC12]|nr:hypothetical protein K445DRAFT_22370 [Daldinia sp. EC12]
MCQLWNQEYSECHHVSRNLIHCPTYYKQQSEANGFFGRLFNSSVRGKKNCGRVIPHYGEPALFCPACSVKNDQLRGNQIGDGALTVRHPRVRDEYQYHSREHRGRSENLTERSHSKPDGHAQQGVWIPGLYYEPENLAQRDHYRRAAGRARPVSPPRATSGTRTHRKAEQKRDKSEVRIQSSVKDRVHKHHERKPEHRHHASANRQPTDRNEGKGTSPVKKDERKPHATAHVKEVAGSNTPRRLRKPVEPAPNRDPRRRQGVTKNNSPRGRSLSRASSSKPLPPTPPPKDSRQRTWMRQIRDSFSQGRPPPAPPPPPANKHPRLRHKPGKVYKVRRTPSPPRPPPRPPPKPPKPPADPLFTDPPLTDPPLTEPPSTPIPEYQVYLNAQRFAASYHPSIERAVETPSLQPPLKPPPQRNKGLYRNPTLRRIASPLRLTDNASDESFVCQDARLVTLNGGNYF